jgi:hypothetical protein
MGRSRASRECPPGRGKLTHDVRSGVLDVLRAGLLAHAYLYPLPEVMLLVQRRRRKVQAGAQVAHEAGTVVCWPLYLLNASEH